MPGDVPVTITSTHSQTPIPGVDRPFPTETTTMQITPYMFFDGKAEEAAEFYKAALGAEVEMMLRFGESPEPAPEGMLPPGSENKIMHMSLKIGESRLYMSDGNCQGQAKFDGSALSLQVTDTEQAERLFAALSEGGTVQMPMGETFFSPRFGMVADRFGVNWMVLVYYADA